MLHFQQIMLKVNYLTELYQMWFLPKASLFCQISSKSDPMGPLGRRPPFDVKKQHVFSRDALQPFPGCSRAGGMWRCVGSPPFIQGPKVSLHYLLDLTLNKLFFPSLPMRVRQSDTRVGFGQHQDSPVYS